MPFDCCGENVFSYLDCESTISGTMANFKPPACCDCQDEQPPSPPGIYVPCCTTLLPLDLCAKVTYIGETIECMAIGDTINFNYNPTLPGLPGYDIVYQADLESPCGNFDFDISSTCGQPYATSTFTRFDELRLYYSSATCSFGAMNILTNNVIVGTSTSSTLHAGCSPFYFQADLVFGCNQYLPVGHISLAVSNCNVTQICNDRIISKTLCLDLSVTPGASPHPLDDLDGTSYTLTNPGTGGMAWDYVFPDATRIFAGYNNTGGNGYKIIRLQTGCSGEWQIIVAIDKICYGFSCQCDWLASTDTSYGVDHNLLTINSEFPFDGEFTNALLYGSAFCDYPTFTGTISGTITECT